MPSTTSEKAAGRAFVRAFLLSNPGFDRALSSWAIAIQKAAPALKVIIDAERKRAEWEANKAAIDAQIAKREAEWEAEFGMPYPRDLEDWERLAVWAGVSGETVFQGKWTPRRLAPIIEGYAMRRKAESPLAIIPAQMLLPKESNYDGTSHLLGLLDDTAIEIGRIVQDTAKTLDQRLREIALIDRRFCGKDSEELAELTGKTSGAVRQTNWWKFDRKRANAVDCEMPVEPDDL